MLKKIILPFAIILIATSAAVSQELNAHVTVSAQQLGTKIEQSVINNLQEQITGFLNNRKWTKDYFRTEEKINCNFSINIQSIVKQDVYKASLIVQAARPVYNSVYSSPLVNYQDLDFVFKFQPFQKLNFNEAQVAGTDMLAANLTAILAYYVNIIIGLDYDSFKENTGVSYFKKALNIVTAAPQSGEIKGWKAFDGQRNRYWLAHNLNDAKLNAIHKVYYSYFRSGLDSMYSHPSAAINNTLSSLTLLDKLNKAYANTMIEQFFVESRSDEFIGIFKKATPTIKAKHCPY